MAIAEELLAVADILSTNASQPHEQGALRRSISTAYYALFHLLVQDAAIQWHGSMSEQLGLERTFKHESMKKVCKQVADGYWKGRSTPQTGIPAELPAIARTFSLLQESRHEADYNNGRSWTITEVQAGLAEARAAVSNWKKIQGTPIASEFLLSLLVASKRQ